MSTEGTKGDGMGERWTVSVQPEDREWVRALAKEHGTTQRVVLDAIFLTALMTDRTGSELAANIQMRKDES